MIKDRHKTIEEIVAIAADLKKQGKKVVTTNGSFDILHPGHALYLEQAKKLGDVLIVLINNDDSITRYKGDIRPINKEEDRILMISALEPVDYVVVINCDKPLGYIEKIKPDIHVKGGTFDLDRVKEEKDLVESWGAKFQNIEMIGEYSTTDLVKKVVDIYKKHGKV